MSAMQKVCPECNTELLRVAKSCGCGHQFTNSHANGPKKPREPKAAPADSTDPEFSCGPTSDGGFMFFWPRKMESYVLTKAERDLMVEVIGVAKVG